MRHVPRQELAKCLCFSTVFKQASTAPPGTSWHWDFGDGATSTQRDSVHEYQHPGTYDVRLTLTTPTGATDHLTTCILIEAPPETFVVEEHDYTEAATDDVPHQASLLERLPAWALFAALACSPPSGW